MNIYQVANAVIKTLLADAVPELGDCACDLTSVETDVNGKESAGFTLYVNGERFNVNVTRQEP